MSDEIRLLSLDKAKERIAHPYTEDELLPLLLFRGSWSMSKAQAMYKIALLMMDTEVPSRVKGREVTAQAHDLLHMTGLHQIAKSGIDLTPALNRIRQCPTVLALNPRLEEYIRWYAENTSSSMVFYDLDPIPRWSVQARGNNKLRYPYKRDGHRGGLRTPVPPKIRDNGIVVPQFYPFIAEQPQEEMDLLMWAHHLVPQSIPDHWRQDICQDLIVALLTGEVTKDNADSSVRKYMSKVFQAYPSKYGALSLDAPFSSDNDGSLMDILMDEAIS